MIRINGWFHTILYKYDKHIKEETEGVVKKYSVICDKLYKYTRKFSKILQNTVKMCSNVFQRPIGIEVKEEAAVRRFSSK